MGFGEVALVLDTMRTASIVADTPCEVFCLSRVDYEEALAAMPVAMRVCPLEEINLKFWAVKDAHTRNSIRHLQGALRYCLSSFS